MVKLYFFQRGVCKFDISSLGSCSEPPYGYDKHKPCLFLKINQVLDAPDVYDKNSELPSFMPEDIKYKIRNSTVSVSNVEIQIFELSLITILKF